MHFFSLFLISAFSLTLVACDSEYTYAPVTDISMIEPIPQTGTHRVAQNETFYEIAWRYGLDYRNLAAHNQMSAPYSVHAGQVIRLRNNVSRRTNGKKIESSDPRSIIKRNDKLEQVEAQPINIKEVRNVSRKKNIMPEAEPNFSISHWIWPAEGKVIGAFSASNKGINIAGRQNNPVYAAAPGKVVYSGDGLRGYGNLIILKHNSLYFSAYAHNAINFVKEGDWVKQGQKIAEMGKTGSDKVMLHFEIRRAGLPIDPIRSLSA